MRRTNRKHTRAIERHRRNDGPALMSQVADQEMKKQASALVLGLCRAIIENGSAPAADLLLQLAESAEWASDPALRERVLSLAERWAKEPQVVALDTDPQLPMLPPPLQLADGSDPATRDGLPAAESEPLEGEYELTPNPPAVS